MVSQWCVAALKEIKVPVLRWPAVVLQMNTIAKWHRPREKRPSMTTQLGGVTEITVSVHMNFWNMPADWMWTITSVVMSQRNRSRIISWSNMWTQTTQVPWRRSEKRTARSFMGVKYWGLEMKAGDAAAIWERNSSRSGKTYGTYMRNYGTNKVFKIACGPNGSDTTGLNYDERIADLSMGFHLHYYSFANQKRAQIWRSRLVNIIQSTLKMKSS